MPIDRSRMRTIRPRVYVSVAILIAGVVLLSQCERPTDNQAKLDGIKTDAMLLMKDRPDRAEFAVLKTGLPPTIASLDPEFVMVSSRGVDIMTKSYFDGGWGYFIPRDTSIPMDPKGRFSDLGNGVYWHHPY